MEKAPAEITGSFCMLFLIVFGRFLEKFSFGIYSPLQPDYSSNTIRLHTWLIIAPYASHDNWSAFDQQ